MVRQPVFGLRLFTEDSFHVYIFRPLNSVRVYDDAVSDIDESACYRGNAVLILACTGLLYSQLADVQQLARP